jgi:N-acetylglutamate synthase-like GNAT family acetyltransferase
MLRVRIKSLTMALSKPKPDTLFLVMEYKKTPIGCVLLQPCKSKGVQPCYRITHFHVDSPYRHAGVGYDLLSRAVEDLPNADILAVTTPLVPYVADCLRAVGFKPNQGAVKLWDKEKDKAEQNEDDEKVDIEQERVVLVDTQRTGWQITRA